MINPDTVRGAFSVLPGAASAMDAGVPVLMYHKVDRVVPNDGVGRSLTIDPAVFAPGSTYLLTAQAIDFSNGPQRTTSRPIVVRVAGLNA